jgi:hypothetical protein
VSGLTYFNRLEDLRQPRRYIRSQKVLTRRCNFNPLIPISDMGDTASRISLTWTEENFTVKAGAQRIAAELGLLLVAPDTSPRGDGGPRDPTGSYDFGLGAGFYVDATQPCATKIATRIAAAR